MDEQTIFSQALAIESAAERSKFLDSACGDDRELRARIERLLRLQEDAGSFLEKTPDELVALAETKAEESEGELADRWKESLEPSDDPNSLGKLGPYEIAELIGRGGMGVVLRAFDSKLKRTVAIKILAPEFAMNPMSVRRFLREARSAAAVSHDHVVTIHAIDEEAQPPRIVMEFVAGQSLQQKIDNEGALDLKSILRIGMQTAAGLSAAHKQGLVHRDIKPSNILLENGIERVKLTDFGLARAVDDIGVTRTGQITGTPQYMSPEQAQGHRVDHRTDLFSLGCVLYAMCTGRAAFRADSAVAVMHRVVHDTPKPIREANEEIPEWLCEIVDKLLEKNPEDRFASANEVEELLGQHLAHLQQPQSVPRPGSIGPTLARVHHQVEQELRFAGRFFLGLGLACLMVFVLTLLGLSNFIFWLSMSPLSMTLPVLIGGIISLPVGLLALNAHFELPRRSGYRWIRLAAGAALIPWNLFLLLALPWTLRIRRMLLRPEVQRQFAVTSDQISSVPSKAGSLGGAPAKVRIVALVGLLVLCLTELFDATNFNDSIERAIAGQGELFIETDVPEAVITLSGHGFSLKRSGSLSQRLPTGSYEVDIFHQFKNGAVGQHHVEYKIGRRETVSDYIPLLRQGVINASQISEFLTDDPDAAKLTVTVADPNVELRLNGQVWNIGGKGTQILPLKPGRYQFLGFVGNAKQIDQAITLKAGDQRSLFFERPRARQSESPDGPALSFPPGSSADLLTSRDYEWTEPENLGPLVNTEYIERNPTLSSDGLTLIFESDRPGGPQPTVEFMPEFNLWQTTRANLEAPWTQPVILSPPVNSAGFDKSPCLSADGLTLLFDSSRAGRTDIWMTTRRSLTGEWTTPLNLREQLDTKGMLDQHPTLSADGLTMFFGSTSAEQEADDYLDLWMSTRKSEQDSWSKGVRLGPGINSQFRENDPMLAADGLSLLLTHGLPHEAPNLHVSTRPDLHTPWSKPIPLSRRIDPDALVFGADFSLPHRTLIFTSARENGEGNFDLWMSRVVSKFTDGRRSENQLATNLPVTSAELLTSDDYEWTEPENLGPLVNTEDEESSPTLTSDGLLMIFARTHIVDPSIDSVRGSLWQSTRTNLNEPWSKPMELSSFINSSNSEMTPCLAGDGLTLFFSSAREGGEGAFDLWVCTRNSREDDWGQPLNLGSLVNSDGSESSPTISEDQLTLIFGSKSFVATTQRLRPAKIPLYEILICSRKSKRAPWSKPVNVATATDINLRGHSPMLAEDGLSLILLHAPHGPIRNLYVSTRLNHESRWANPISLSTRIDPNIRIHSAHFSYRQQTLYYSSAGEGDSRNLDLWMTKLVRKRSLAEGPAGPASSMSDQQWKDLLSKAASIPLNEWNTLAGDIKGPNAVAVRGEPLSLVLLNLDPFAEQKQNEHVIRDFWYLTESLPKPQELANAISVSREKGYVSFLQPERMTNLTFEEADGTVEGSVGFSVPKLYSGRVEFMARRYYDNIWRIDEFRLPNYDITLRRNTQNLWQKVRTDRISGNRAEGSRSSP